MLQLSLLTVALAGRAWASLQDLTKCDPLKKDSTCPPNPAFAGKASFDFTTSSWDDTFQSFWSVDSDTSSNKSILDFDTDGKGVAFSIWGPGKAPTLASKKYLLFGKISVEVQAALGQGVVTAIVLQSDSGDEADWEFLGAYENQAQTNYYHDGEALFNTYNDTHQLDSSTATEFHTYSVDWTEHFLAFSIDGINRKTWHVGEITSKKWPQTPMQVKLGIWAVSDNSNSGTIDWAGGAPQWDNGPFKAYFKGVTIEDYVGNCLEVEGDDVEYVYDERTLGWEDVEIRGCKKKLTPGMFTPDTSSDTQPPKETGSASQGSGEAGGQSTSLIGGTEDTPTPTPTLDPTTGGPDKPPPSKTAGTTHAKTGTEAAPPQESGGENDDDQKAGGGGKNDNAEDQDDIAPFALDLSSPLAAVVFLGWLLLF